MSSKQFIRFIAFSKSEMRLQTAGKIRAGIVLKEYSQIKLKIVKSLKRSYHSIRRKISLHLALGN